MLERIRLENFRCFKDLQVSDFAAINLIVGKNNTGKSCFLDAVAILTQPNMQSLLATLQRRNPVDNGQALEWSNLLSLIRHENTGENVEVSPISRLSSLDGSLFEVHRELSQAATFPGRSPFRLRCRNHLGQQWSFFEDDSGLARLVPGSSGVTGATDPYVGWESRNIQVLAQNWDRLVTLGREDKVIEWLRILDPDLKKIQFTKSAYEGKHRGIYLFGEGSTPLSLAEQGDGFRRVLEIAIATHCAEHTVLIDELELGIHFSALKPVWNALLTIARQQGLQFFVTTHSLDCLRALAQVAAGPDAGLVRAFRLRDGGRHVVSYTGEELLAAVATEAEIR